MEKLTRVVGQRIRNYDLSRRRDYLLSRRLWNPGPSLRPRRVRTYDRICGRILVLHRDAVSWDFLSKFMKVDIRRDVQTLIFV